jgi:dTDP-4-dehydrorhamnose 3,5-epimerase-like enzyme
MSIADCKILSLPKISSTQGSISFIENMNHIPFEVRRIYYLYHLPENACRGAHGHKTLQQLIIALSGAFDFTVDDGQQKKTFHLSKPDEGLYVPPGLWRDLNNFTKASVCLVLASELYTEEDYYRNYQEFLNAVRPSQEKQFHS